MNKLLCVYAFKINSFFTGVNFCEHFKNRCRMALGHLISNGRGNSVFARPLYLANSKRTNNVNGGKKVSRQRVVLFASIAKRSDPPASGEYVRK